MQLLPPDDLPVSTPGSPISVQPSLEAVLLDFAAAQEQLDQLKRQVMESQRLATIGTIAAVIAHEFNNLLTPIVSYSQYALTSAESEKPDMEMIRKALSKSYQSSVKAGRICSSMLSLARGESTPATVQVQMLVDETLLVMARDPQKDGLALRVQIQPNLTVTGDPVQLEQVLLNLLINARQAMAGKSGSLTIKAAEDPEQAGEVKIQVIDTGPGIPEKLLPKIFQPFFTTKGTAKKGEPKGTGLGLAICKEIVEHHNGRISVESVLGRGATFTLHLPQA
ncbi:MAG TPA: ATP-binding protein [Tepidisphaeraceae bacterium]|nr:ATP-binding protein [Tepidisphaeraceae bacterium]